jgi:hypothetical protein
MSAWLAGSAGVAIVLVAVGLLATWLLADGPQPRRSRPMLSLGALVATAAVLTVVVTRFQELR